MVTFSVIHYLFLILGAKAVLGQDICPNSTGYHRKFSILNSIPLTSINKTSLIFSVHACEDVRIILTGNLTDFGCSYRIVLGYVQPSGEELSKLKACKACNGTFDTNKCETHTAMTPSILDCNEFRTFWISMSGGLFRFGKGNKLYSDQIENIGLFDLISPDFMMIRVYSVNGSRWRVEKEFLPYISTDLYCETNKTLELKSSVDVTTSTGYVTAFTKVTTTSSEVTEEDFCKCPCSTHKWDYLNSINLTKDQLRKELSAYLYELQQSIAINTKETSKNKAKRVSAGDKRVSSTTLGWLGAFVAAAVPISFICIDLLKVFKQI